MPRRAAELLAQSPSIAAAISAWPSPKNPGATWSSSDADTWITFTDSGASGSGTVNVTTAPNSTGVARISRIVIARVSAPVTEDATAQVFPDVLLSAHYFDLFKLLPAKSVTHACTQPVTSNEDASRAQVTLRRSFPCPPSPASPIYR